MKKIGFLFLSLLLLAACSSNPQTLAEKGVRTYLKKSTKSPNIYEPVSFGKLDTIGTDKDSIFKNAQDSLQIYLDLLTKPADQFVLAHSQNRAKALKTTILDLTNFYKLRKFKIEHKYKTNNEEQDKMFYLNSLFEVVE